MMIRLQTIILTLILGVMPAMAHYTVKGISGQVQIKQGTRVLTAISGMQIKAADLIIIGNDSSIDILDSIDSQIYTSSTPGQVTVTRIMFEAKKKARSNSDTVHDKIRMGKSTKQGDGVVYVDKGKVTRALSTYDPEADRVQVDVDQLSKRLYAMLADSLRAAASLETSVIIRNARTESNGLRFMVENTLTFPIYFNLFKVNAGHPDSGIAISELGQPVGSYALQPAQTIAREQTVGLNPEETHLLIMTNYYFEIDELLTKLNKLITDHAEVSNTGDFPLYIRAL